MSLSVYGTSYAASSQTISYDSTNTTVLYIKGAFPSSLTASTTSTITLTITSLVNPSIYGTSGEIAITTLNSAKYIMDTTYTGLTLTLTTAGIITFGSIVPSTFEVDATTTVTFTLTSNIQYLSGGYISIVAPTSYIKVPTSSVTCSGTTGFKTGTTAVCTNDGAYTVNITRDVDYTVYTKVFSASFTNPLGVIATMPSFSVYYYSPDGDLLASITSGVIYTSLLKGACYLASAPR